MKKKCTKKKLTAEQKAAQLKKRKVLAFRKKIRSSFTDAGFTYFSTLDKHFPIGTRTVELDYLFLYENIIVICEDNTKQKKLLAPHIVDLLVHIQHTGFEVQVVPLQRHQLATA